MRLLSPDLVYGKNVLLRMDIDVPIRDGQVEDDTRLLAGLESLKLCLESAKAVTVMGHIGRPEGKIVEKLSVGPIVKWFENKLSNLRLTPGKLQILENLRFEKGEEAADLEYARKLAEYGDFFVNEAFASHHSSASTTELPKLLPHAAGLQFFKEVETLMQARDNPQKPQIGIIGGAKVEDKYQAIEDFSKFCDEILVGGLLTVKIREQGLKIPENVLMAKNDSTGFDISPESIQAFSGILRTAKQIIWAGPMGKWEDPSGIAGTRAMAEIILGSNAEKIIVGGGDTTAALKKLDLLERFQADNRIFVSTGGGAMLKILSTGTLPTIEALK